MKTAMELIQAYRQSTLRRLPVKDQIDRRFLQLLQTAVSGQEAENFRAIYVEHPWQDTYPMTWYAVSLNRLFQMKCAGQDEENHSIEAYPLRGCKKMTLTFEGSQPSSVVLSFDGANPISVSRSSVKWAKAADALTEGDISALNDQEAFLKFLDALSDGLFTYASR